MKKKAVGVLEVVAIVRWLHYAMKRRQTMAIIDDVGRLVLTYLQPCSSGIGIFRSHRRRGCRRCRLLSKFTNSSKQRFTTRLTRHELND